MSTCAACDGLLPNDHPAHHIILEIEDRTRSTKQFMGDETNVTRVLLAYELCGGCWKECSEKVS